MAETNDAGEVFEALLERGEDSIDLPAAWCALTRSVRGEIDARETLKTLAELKLEVERVIPRHGYTVRERLTALMDFFTSDLGFRGNQDHYADPENSFVDRVLERRVGIPISLSIVFIELAAACGLDIDPIGFPGHFLVRERTEGILCDPFSGRIDIQGAECLNILSEISGGAVEWNDDYLRVASKVEILQRILNNLRNSYAQTAELDRLGRVERMIDRLNLLDIPSQSSALN
jgi:regulator of sirC expression with transglutaminase-like and TPR domain